MRIALIGTPRSGNNWLRAVLAETLELTPVAVHNYLEAPVPLPERCIFGTHWYREPNFQRYVREQGSEVLDKILATGELGDDVAEKLTALIQGAVELFIKEHPEAARAEH